MARAFNFAMVSPLHIAARPPPFDTPMCNAVKMSVGSPMLSAQAVAARTRRKRISEKFRELGELIPGGSRLNTADMLTAGFNYVLFMQAQIGVLGVMRSVQGWNAPREQDRMIGVLVASPPIQEKLAREGHCVLPSAVLEAVFGDENIKSGSCMEEEDIDRFID